MDQLQLKSVVGSPDVREVGEDIIALYEFILERLFREEPKEIPEEEEASGEETPEEEISSEEEA